MAHFISNETMLELVKKVQPLQLDIVATGRSAHLDVGVHEPLFFEIEPHISFDLTVFEDHDLVKSFEFSANDDQDELENEFNRLSIYVRKIKAQ